jgi:ribonuclease HII
MLQPYLHKNKIEAGCDEAGRGCLAGPVYAAAVILPKDFYHPLLNDSKLISEKKRELLRPIIEREAIAFAVSKVSPKVIDKINILQASFRAMHLAINRLEMTPELLLIDGNRFKSHKRIKHNCIIKGDCKFASIAAASVLAKTYRDDYMLKAAKKFPEYGWDRNKGYGTKEHREALRKHDRSVYHRFSFSF